MTPPYFDSILAEVHAVKDSVSKEFNHDVAALCLHLRKLDSAASQPLAASGRLGALRAKPNRKQTPKRNKRKILAPSA